MEAHFYLYLFAVEDFCNSSTKISTAPENMETFRVLIGNTVHYQISTSDGTLKKKYQKLFSSTFLGNSFIYYEMLEIGS